MIFTRGRNDKKPTLAWHKHRKALAMGDTPMDAAFKAMIAEQERDARFAAAADLERARATAVEPRSGDGARWGWLLPCRVSP